MFDPFMGAGQTALACLQRDRRYLGYDLDQSHVEIGERQALLVRTVGPDQVSKPRSRRTRLSLQRSTSTTTASKEPS